MAMMPPKPPVLPSPEDLIGQWFSAAISGGDPDVISTAFNSYIKDALGFAIYTNAMAQRYDGGA